MLLVCLLLVVVVSHIRLLVECLGGTEKVVDAAILRILALYLYTSIPLYLYTSIPLYLYTSMPLYLHTSVPLYLYTSIPLYYTRLY